MKLGMVLRFPGEAGLDMAPVLEAERLGYSEVWVGEAYGSDAVSPTAWMLARTTKIKVGTGIMQIPARTHERAARCLLDCIGDHGSAFWSSAPGARSFEEPEGSLP